MAICIGVTSGRGDAILVSQSVVLTLTQRTKRYQKAQSAGTGFCRRFQRSKISTEEVRGMFV